MDAPLTSLQELRLSFRWSWPREPKWVKEREDAPRALLGLLPMPRRVAFLLAEYRRLLQGLRESATVEWARKNIDRLERELATQQIASPIADEDWLEMAELGPTSLRDGLRELWRAASEWQTKAEQADLDAGFFMMTVGLDCSTVWSARSGSTANSHEWAADEAIPGRVSAPRDLWLARRAVTAANHRET